MLRFNTDQTNPYSSVVSVQSVFYQEGTAMFLTRDQVRNVDRLASETYGVPGIVLMENAGRGAADLLMRLGIFAPVIICCGKGSNGGDGYVIARHLDLRQISVKVLLFANPSELTGDAAINFQVLKHAGLPVQTLVDATTLADRLRHELQNCEWVVDALFGTGLSGPVRAPYDKVIEVINHSGRRVLAVDIPSGLDADTGRPLGPTVRAEHTATFVALKKGFANPAARGWTGQVHVLDIGAPRSCVEAIAAGT
jgi:NAD(P)H-hydrate epimerase